MSQSLQLCRAHCTTTPRAWLPSTRPSRCQTHKVAAVCSAAQQNDQAVSSSSRNPAVQCDRRTALMGGMAAVTALLGVNVSEAQARYGNWDNESAALGSCAIGDEGDECRKAVLLKDSGAGSRDYATQMKRQGQMGEIASGVPVSVLDDEYGRSTVALAAAVEKYAGLDLYDPERAKMVAEIKKDAGNWVSKYARGGSARKQSARKMYIVADALEGHFASNGFAPLPKPKLKKILDGIDEARELLAAGK